MSSLSEILSGMLYEDLRLIPAFHPDTKRATYACIIKLSLKTYDYGFMGYGQSPEEAVADAVRLVKEAQQ